MESGTDPVEAFAETIKEALSDAQLDRLHDMGFSVRDLTEYLMNGRPAASALGMALEDINRAAGQGGSIGEMQELGREAVLTADMVAAAADSVDSFFDIRSDELVDAAIASGKALNMTSDDLRALAEDAINTFGYNITDDQFVAGLQNLPILMSETENRAGQMSLSFFHAQRDMQQAMAETDMAWQDYLDPTQKDQIVDQFMEDNIAAVQTFASTIQQEFERIEQTIKGGFPAWDEYEQVILGAVDEAGNLTGPGGINAALEAQRMFLEDTAAFVNRMPSMLEMGASADTVAWLEGLDGPIRGAIGRLNDSQLEELIAGANANFDALAELHGQRWMQVYPENANLAFGAMVGELTGRVDEMKIPGEGGAEAFFEGLMTMAETLPEANREDFLSYIQSLLDAGTLPYEEGWGLIQDWLDGAAVGISGMSRRLIPIIDSETGKIKGAIKDGWIVSSPSKWWQNLGEQMVAGLEIGLSGMGSAFGGMGPNQLMPEMIAGTGSMSTVNNTRNANYSLTVNGAGGNNLNAEAQTLLTLLTIVGGVERGAGR